MNDETQHTTNDTALNELVNTLLYEGYALYPYRNSALKNKTPIPFGVVYPESYCAYNKYMHCKMQTECLVKCNDETALTISIKFLHLHRDDTDNSSAWKAIEREIREENLSIQSLLQSKKTSFRFNKNNSDDDDVSSINGTLTIQAFEIAGIQNIFRISVIINNTTHVDNAGSISNNEVLKHAFVSTHTILKTTGEFISDQNPSSEFKDAVKQNKNLNTYPVLIDEANTIMLSSPIILYDYPQIHASSMGDLFDGTEMEEALLLHVNVLTDEEKKQVINANEKLRLMMDKVSNVTPDAIINLHDKLKENKFFDV